MGLRSAVGPLAFYTGRRIHQPSIRALGINGPSTGRRVHGPSMGRRNNGPSAGRIINGRYTNCMIDWPNLGQTDRTYICTGGEL